MRTVLINPTDEVTAAYKALVAAFDAALKAIVSGKLRDDRSASVNVLRVHLNARGGRGRRVCVGAVPCGTQSAGGAQYRAGRCIGSQVSLRASDGCHANALLLPPVLAILLAFNSRRASR